MGSMDQGPKALNYPEPLKGPEVPYKHEPKQNPALRGFVLVLAAWCMEWFRFIREAAWKNAGFGAVRGIRAFIEDYEPWFEPLVIVFPDSDIRDRPSTETAAAAMAAAEKETADMCAKYPEARYYSAADYRKLYLAGEITPTEVANAILPLIRRDTTPPGDHSVAWFDTKVDLVLKAAEASTQRYREKRSLGPLDGVPTAVKDEYDVDGYRTTLGSINDYTSSVAENGSRTVWPVRKLEAAGAINLGKLSMHEFGLDTTSNNPIYGTPLNPHNPYYYTGGSSSGTGYAIATGLIPIGLGSDGGGSIRIPSSFCGIFGLKPTHARIGFKPSQNHCPTCAVLGPMAADIESLAVLFQVMAEPHPTSNFPALQPLQLTISPSTPRLLGIPQAWFSQASPRIQTVCRRLVDRLVSTHGYQTVDINIPFVKEGQIAHAVTVLSDAATLLPETGGLTPANRILLALGRVTPSTDALLATKLRRLLMQHLAYLWQTHPGMLIITPTTACAGWPIRGGKAELKYGVNDGDTTIESMKFVWLANFCGLPSISVPAGIVEGEMEGKGGVPVGLMATGEWCSEEKLLQFGRLAEREGMAERRRPRNWVDVVDRARKKAS